MLLRTNPITSGIQVIPELAKEADELYVFQRSPAWCDRKNDEDLSSEYWNELRKPGQYDALREELLKGHEVSQGEKMTPETNLERRARLQKELEDVVDDPATAQLLTPTYPIGCKRVCYTDVYWQSFNRKNVHLVDVSQEHGVSEINAQGPVVMQQQYELDAIVYATGYDAMTGTFKGIDIRGREGRSLEEHWDKGVRSLFGKSVR